MADKVDVLASMQAAENFLFRDAADKGLNTSVGANELRQARGFVAGLIGAAQKVMAKHDADAVECNFARCGCDYCKALRPALASLAGAAQ